MVSGTNRSVKNHAKTQTPPNPANTGALPKRCRSTGNARPTTVLKRNWEPREHAMAAERQRLGKSSAVRMLGMGPRESTKKEPYRQRQA